MRPLLHAVMCSGLLATSLAAEVVADEILKVRGAVPSVVHIEPGEREIRLALYGSHLDQATGGTAFRDGRRVDDVAVRLGARSPAVRDVFVRASPTAVTGEYNIAVSLDRHRVYLPVVVRVVQPRPESGRRVPEPSTFEAARRNQDAAARASLIGR